MGYKSGGPSIGGGISIRLAKDGFKVVVVDTCGMGNRTVEMINNRGGEAIYVEADVVVTEDVKNTVEIAASTYGGLTCLVNCVARYSMGMAKNIVDITEEEWNQTLNVNLNGYFKMTKYSIPLILKSGGGTVVNISSVGSLLALPNFSVYSVSKAAIDALTRTVAVDFAPNIRANAVLPGFVRIANSENSRSSEELAHWYDGIAKQYPMRRVCEVDEISDVVAFLASDGSSYINGQTIVVDGGKTISDVHEF